MDHPPNWPPDPLPESTEALLYDLGLKRTEINSFKIAYSPAPLPTHDADKTEAIQKEFFAEGNGSMDLKCVLLKNTFDSKMGVVSSAILKTG